MSMPRMTVISPTPELADQINHDVVYVDSKHDQVYYHALPNQTHGDKTMQRVDFMAAVEKAADSNGHPITNKTWNEAFTIISEFAEIWDNAPDGKEFGCGLKNRHFLRCKEFIQDH